MRKLLIVILLTCLLIDFQSIETNVKNGDITTDKTISSDNIVSTSSDNTIGIINKYDYSNSQNDLVYRDYGSSRKITKNSKLMISLLNLNLNDETAVIYVINLETNYAFKLYDYQPNQNILYIPNIDGIYKIIAETSNGEVIDLTPMAYIEVAPTEENSGGFILLQ